MLVFAIKSKLNAQLYVVALGNHLSLVRILDLATAEAVKHRARADCLTRSCKSLSSRAIRFESAVDVGSCSAIAVH